MALCSCALNTSFVKNIILVHYIGEAKEVIPRIGSNNMRFASLFILFHIIVLGNILIQLILSIVYMEMMHYKSSASFGSTYPIY